MTAAPSRNRFFGLGLREIETILVLAEELHFGRAAERLLVSTSWVSHTVRAFECRVGGRVFERTSRRVLLTPLGAALVAELAPVVEALERTLRRAREQAGEVVGRLGIGHLTGVSDVPELQGLIEAFERRHPTCHLVRLRFDSLTYFRSVERGELDLWITWWPGPFPSGEAVRAGPPIASREAALLVDRTHPLAGRPCIGLDELTVHPVLRMPATCPALFRRGWTAIQAPNGLPIATVEADWAMGTFGELARNLAPGTCGWLAPASVLDETDVPGGLVAVPIRDGPRFRLLPLWRPSAATAAVTAFVGMAGRRAGKPDQAGTAVHEKSNPACRTVPPASMTAKVG